MKFKTLAYIFLLSIIFGQGASNFDITDDIHPISIAPYPQSGYGSGDDQLGQPDDVELLSDGSMIVSDVDNNRIQHFSPDGKLLKSIDSKNLGLGNTAIIPTGISKDNDGNIYVTLEGAGVVARFNSYLGLDQFIGQQCLITADEYYERKNNNCLIKPQGLITAANGDIYVIDMAKEVFRKGTQRNFGFRKFIQVQYCTRSKYIYDKKFAKTQEITKIMRKSEGMAIDEKRGLLFIAEEKPAIDQFGNVNKKRYIAEFDLKTGKFNNRLIGVTMENDSIVDGYFYDSVEGLCVWNDYLFAVDEKAGKIYIFDIDSGSYLGSFGTRAYYYCDDESDCIIDGVNYNEQTIIVGTAVPHLKNDWKKNELASPDGISVITLQNGSKRLAVVDQWNSRIVIYDLDDILKSL